jgi:hypothetical protein
MKDELYNKIVSWTRESADDFHHGILKGTNSGNYLWQEQDNGTYLYRQGRCMFFGNNGSIFKLSSVFGQTDWLMHNRLYDLIGNDHRCRIEIPIHCEYITLEGCDYQYTEVKRPNNELGMDPIESLFDQSITTQMILDQIDSTSILLNYYKLLYKQFDCNFPHNITKLRIDSQGHFWSDFKLWDSKLSTQVRQLKYNMYFVLIAWPCVRQLNLDTKIIVDKMDREWIV